MTPVEVDWGNLTVGVAALVVLLLVLLGIGGLLWKFGPKIIESWNGLAGAIDGMADAVKQSGESLREQTKTATDQLNRIEHGVDRVHVRLDTWSGGGGKT